MNIALEKTHEYVNGQLRHNYGDAFVRGNNGLFSCSPLLGSIANWCGSALYFGLIMSWFFLFTISYHTLVHQFSLENNISGLVI